MSGEVQQLPTVHSHNVGLLQPIFHCEELYVVDPLVVLLGQRNLLASFCEEVEPVELEGSGNQHCSEAQEGDCNDGLMRPCEILLPLHIIDVNAFPSAECNKSIGDNRLVVLPNNIEPLEQYLGTQVGVKEQKLCSFLLEAQIWCKHLFGSVLAINLHSFEWLDRHVHLIVL